jgi:hypothetical protein
VVASNNFKQQLKDLFEKEGLKCTIEETDNGLLVVEKKGRFRAELDGRYWYVNHYGNVDCGIEKFDSDDNYRHAIHNYYKTIKEAEQYQQDQLKLGQLKDYILELRNQGFRVEFQATDITVAELIGEKFGAVSLF